MVCLKGFEDGRLRLSVCGRRLSEADRPVRIQLRIFDNKVERASREKSFEFKFERSHIVISVVVPSGAATILRPPSESIFRFQTRV